MDESEYWSLAGVWFLFLIAVLAGTGLCSYIKSCRKSLKELTTPPSPPTVDTSSSSPPMNTQITWISDFTAGDSPVLPHVPRIQPITDDLPTYDEAVASSPITWLCSTRHVDDIAVLSVPNHVSVSSLALHRFCIKFNSITLAISCKFIQISKLNIKIHSNSAQFHLVSWTWFSKWPLDVRKVNVVSQAAARWQARSDFKTGAEVSRRLRQPGETDGIDFSAPLHLTAAISFREKIVKIRATEGECETLRAADAESGLSLSTTAR
jgi:hypothetical protein